MQADKPAQQRVSDQCAGCAPDPNRKILERVVLDLGIGAKQLHREIADRPLQQKKSRSDRQCNDDGLPKGHTEPIVVMGAEALRRNSGRPHAQEVDAGIDESEDRATDGDRAEVRGVIQMPGNARVHHAEQRHRDIGQNQRRGDAPDISILREAIRAQAPIIRRR